MNFTESFQDFSSKLSTMDLALYAGIGIVLWVLFKDKLSPVQRFLLNAFNMFSNKLTENSVSLPMTETPKVNTEVRDDIFFRLVVSWKQTRDLAQKSGCAEAVKVADQMFPHLSPTVCKEAKV